MCGQMRSDETEGDVIEIEGDTHPALRWMEVRRRKKRKRKREKMKREREREKNG